jgi:hypothetical protein
MLVLASWQALQEARQGRGGAAVARRLSPALTVRLRSLTRRTLASSQPPR